MTRKLQPPTAAVSRDVQVVLSPDLARKMWEEDQASGVKCVSGEPVSSSENAGATTDGQPDRQPGTGRFAAGNALSRKGGIARVGQGRLAERVGLSKLPAGHPMAAVRRAASRWREEQCERLTTLYGELGPAPKAIIASAARYFALGCAIADWAMRENLPLLGIKGAQLETLARESLREAYELAALEAEADRQSSATQRPVIRIIYPHDIDKDEPS